MSVFTNTTTNITAPVESCSYIGYEYPPGNSTQVACSIPDCLDNRAAIEKCCTGGSLTTFNDTRNVPQLNITIDAQWAVCTLNDSLSGLSDLTPYDPNEPFFSLPDCIVRNGGSRLLCNRPNSNYQSCSGPNGIQTAGGTGTGFSTCTVNNQNENITASLRSCCQSANGTLRSEVEGCQVSCSGDETLQPCLARNARSIDAVGFGYLCSNRTDSKTGGAGTMGGSAKTTLASVLLATVAALAILQ